MPGTRLVLVLALGLALSAPTALRAREGSTARLDRFGDPLPEGAVARPGTVRFHGCGCAAYSPDGKSIATANGDEVSLGDVATSGKIRQLRLKDRTCLPGTFQTPSGSSRRPCSTRSETRKRRAVAAGPDEATVSGQRVDRP